MIYTPLNVQQKTGRSGKNYIIADFQDMNGQIHQGVSTFDPVKDGVSLDGQITQNGEYLNFKAQASIPTGGKAGVVAKQVEQAQERTSQNVAIAQENREKGVINSGSITNATHLVVAMLEADVIPKGLSTESDIKNKIREYIVWYREMYTNPQAVAPF